MDPLHAWKDDFRREVEEVLAARSRSREIGQASPEEGFGGRLSDLVIPPAGAYAELRETAQRLKLAQDEALELRARLDAKESALERQRESQERLKEGFARLSLALREERAARGAAEEAARQAGERAEAAALASVRNLQARLDLALLDADAKGAEAASLAARLEAAGRRVAQEAARGEERLGELRGALSAAEAELAAARADAAARDSLSLRLERERFAALEEELRARIARVEREAGERARNAYAEGIAAARQRVEAAEKELEASRRAAAEAARRGAALEEEKAKLGAQFEEERGRLEAEMDAERRAASARWREQAEALERLRKEFEHGRRDQ